MGCGRRWAPPRPAGCAREAVFAEPRWPAYVGRARRCSRLRAARPGSSRCRWRRRSSTSAASADSGTPTEIAVRLRRDVRDGSGCRSPSGSRGRSSLAKIASRGGQARRPAAGRARARARVPASLPSAALGRRPGDRGAAAARGIPTVGEIAALSEAELVAMLGRGSGGHLHALAHTAIRGGCGTGRRRRSMGSQSALGASRGRPRARPGVVALVDRVSRRMGPPGARGARSRCGCASATTRGHPLAHALAADRGHGHDPGGARARLRAARLDDRAPRADAGRDQRSPTSTPAASSSSCPSPGSASARSTPPSTSFASGSGRRRSPGPPCSAAGARFSPSLMPATSPMRRGEQAVA